MQPTWILSLLYRHSTAASPVMLLLASFFLCHSAFMEVFEFIISMRSLNFSIMARVPLQFSSVGGGSFNSAKSCIAAFTLFPKNWETKLLNGNRHSNTKGNLTIYTWYAMATFILRREHRFK